MQDSGKAMVMEMTGWQRSIGVAGAAGTVLSVIALGAAAGWQGLPVWMPLNATSHVLHGAEAGRFHGIDLAHTGLGTAIHVGACFFWAAVAFLWLRVRSIPAAGNVWAAGLGTAVLAAAVDYGLMPERLTPGWELVLPPAGLAAGFAGLGIGIAAGLAATRSSRRAGVVHGRG